MKQTVNFCDFCDAFRNHGRQDSFSHEGKRALFDWIEEIDEDCGRETELDVVALDCEFSEHASALDCIKDMGYGFEPGWHDDDDGDDPRERNALEWLNNRTTVITFDGGVIIQGF
jgi:hypothetical protein